MSLLDQCVALAHTAAQTQAAEQLAERGARFKVNWLTPSRHCELYAQREDSSVVWLADLQQPHPLHGVHARRAQPPSATVFVIEWLGSFEPWMLRSLRETLARLPWAPMTDYLPLLPARLAARMPRATYELREFVPNAGFDFTLYAHTRTQSVGIKLRLLPHQQEGIEARIAQRDTELHTPRELLEWLCATLQPYVDAPAPAAAVLT